MPQAVHFFVFSKQMSRLGVAGRILLATFLIACAPVGQGFATDLTCITVTNLQQLNQIFSSARSLPASLKLEATVCAASRSEIGAVVVQDATSAEMLQMDGFGGELHPGAKIHIESARCLLRSCETGVEISGVPLVDSDGLHPVTESSSGLTLSAGYHPLRLEWFNGINPSVLEVACEGPQMPLQKIPVSSLWRSEPSNRTSYLPGLEVQCYEGNWNYIPDFNLLSPAKTGSVADIGIDFCTQPEFVGLRFTGLFKAPRDGDYNFHVRSDDGALLFIDEACPLVQGIGHEPAPAAVLTAVGQEMTNLSERRWVSVEGRVSFITQTGRGLKLELRSSSGSLELSVADAKGLAAVGLYNARLRARGVGLGVLTLEKKLVLGRVLVASAEDLEILEPALGTVSPPPELGTAEQVQRLHREAAERHLPVRIRGVVTSALTRSHRGLSIQDDTRGIFVNLHGVTNTVEPACGELWEITGHTMPGDFAPSIFAEDMQRLGPGHLPAPAHPTWNQLINGSMDVQWVELRAIVTAISSNMLTLLLPEGTLRARFELQNENDLKPYLDCHVLIRGTLFANWNADTHEVLPGQITFRNARLNADRPAPADVFDAPLKTPRELLRFDVQATTFQRVKLRGQVIYVDSQQVFLMDGKSGVRLLSPEKNTVFPGDLVEAVGYPEIGGFSPALREAVIRKTGVAALPAVGTLADSEITQTSYDCTRVRLAGKLVGWHTEANSLLLDMQSGSRLYVARLASLKGAGLSLRLGSQLELTGVYVAQIRGQHSDAVVDDFDLLLNSRKDITVLSQPSWWTLPRLLGLVGVLVFILILASLWISQLRQQVEQRTLLLQQEIRERERAERRRAIEAERSRIARDLHDDLGSTLTEIGVLASTGIRTPSAEEKSPGLFRSINDKARALIAALDVIVWAVDPEENSLQSLADYLSGYAAEYLENSGIACRFKIPVALPAVTLDGRVRHDLFLAIKEALHNVVRHSRATEVEFHLAVADSTLEMLIADNGCGFAPREGDGHGLKNLPERLAQMGGRCEVTSGAGRGTQVKILLPLSQSATAD